MNTSSKLLLALFGLCLNVSSFAQQCSGNGSSSSSTSSGGGVHCVPEPSSLPLVLLALVGAVLVGRFLKKK